MTLIQRIGYYLGGFSIGIIVLLFFLSGKRTSCSYGPDARVLKNISTKTLKYSNTALKALKHSDIDSLAVLDILRHGDVNFSKSNTKHNACKIYVIEGHYNDTEIALTIENCEHIANIQAITIK